MKRLLLATAASVALLSASATLNTASASEPNQVFGMLFGAAAGGLIGSHVGSGDGRVVATALGTLIGAGIGANVAGTGTVYHRNAAYRPYTYSRTTWSTPHVQRRPYVHVDRRTYVDQRTIVTRTQTTVRQTYVHPSRVRYDRPYHPYWPGH